MLQEAVSRYYCNWPEINVIGLWKALRNSDREVSVPRCPSIWLNFIKYDIWYKQRKLVLASCSLQNKNWTFKTPDIPYFLTWQEVFLCTKIFILIGSWSWHRFSPMMNCQKGIFVSKILSHLGLFTVFQKFLKLDTDHLWIWKRPKVKQCYLWSPVGSRSTLFAHGVLFLGTFLQSFDKFMHNSMYVIIWVYINGDYFSSDRKIILLKGRLFSFYSVYTLTFYP